MATSSEMQALVNMIGRVGRQLERIADAMERQSPPPSAARPVPPRALPLERPAGEVDVSRMGF